MHVHVGSTLQMRVCGEKGGNICLLQEKCHAHISDFKGQGGGGGAQVFGIDVLLPKTMGIIGGGDVILFTAIEMLCSYNNKKTALRGGGYMSLE